MKKIMNMCFAIVFCLCMAACGKGNLGQQESPGPSSYSENDNRNPATVEPSEAPIADAGGPSDIGLTEGLTLTSSVPAETDAQVLEEPPALVVSTINNADSVTVSCSNYQWSIEMPDGMASIIACGAHPLDEINERAILYTAFSAGSLLKDQLSGSFLPAFYLYFGDVLPETVTVRRWPSTYIGHASEYDGDSEEVTVDFSDGFTILPLGDGEFVYEVHAEWGEVGSADYVFSTVPRLRDAD